ncbi:hypothetical protein AB0M80_05645 [Amycolatopsis sp. NPDC051045]|uniref:hypothetical protein n=1 Tax=Amycolatopsis sp. NPDC051045 TaxID=3156922 RepID=UPI00341F06D6
MTGPEHYMEAERLLAKYGNGYVLPETAGKLAAAQVHATLALAAATAMAAYGETMPPPDGQAWDIVAGVEQ